VCLANVIRGAPLTRLTADSIHRSPFLLLRWSWATMRSRTRPRSDSGRSSCCCSRRRSWGGRWCRCWCCGWGRRRRRRWLALIQFRARGNVAYAILSPFNEHHAIRQRCCPVPIACGIESGGSRRCGEHHWHPERWMDPSVVRSRQDSWSGQLASSSRIECPQPRTRRKPRAADRESRGRVTWPELVPG
jgi:hypothetical protein